MDLPLAAGHDGGHPHRGGVGDRHATLSTPIGQTSLVITSLPACRPKDWVFVLFGCLAAAVLAIAVDQLWP